MVAVLRGKVGASASPRDGGAPVGPSMHGAFVRQDQDATWKEAGGRLLHGVRLVQAVRIPAESGSTEPDTDR